jgi:hypothetical protein
MGPPNEEQTAAWELVKLGKVKVTSRHDAPSGGVIFVGNAESKPVEALIDPDGRIRKGKCLCGHHQKAGLRMGPCRHLLALRQHAWQGENQPNNADAWYQGLQRWANS